MNVSNTQLVICIELPADRDYTGNLVVKDASEHLLAGPFRIAGRAADSIAAEHGNATRATVLPFGDTPSGSYRVAAVTATGRGTRYRGDLFGAHGAIVLTARDGDAALADANGRFEILIHGGALSADGRLRMTSGHLRMSDEDLRHVISIVKDAPGAICYCSEAQIAHDAIRVVNATAKIVPQETVSEEWITGYRIPHASRELVAFGEYSPNEPEPGEIDAKTGAEIAGKAASVAQDYAGRSVSYSNGGDASAGGTTSDCSHFVHDVLSRFDRDLPYTTTSDIHNSSDFVKVTIAEARSGDVLVEGGHMGIYSGRTDANGHLIGYQMGKGGAREGPWGPGGWFPGKLEVYRLKTSGD